MTILFSIVVIICLYTMNYTFRLSKKVLECQQTNDQIIQRINHIYMLLDIVTNGLNSRPHQLIFNEFKNIKMNELPNDYKEFMELIKKISIENFEKTTKQLKSLINAPNIDPIRKENLEKRLIEIENIFVLMSTLNGEESNEFAQLTLQNVQASMLKLAEIIDEENESETI